MADPTTIAREVTAIEGRDRYRPEHSGRDRYLRESKIPRAVSAQPNVVTLIEAGFHLRGPAVARPRSTDQGPLRPTARITARERALTTRQRVIPASRCR